MSFVRYVRSAFQLLGAAALGLGSAAAQAGAYPERAVTIVVPFAAGGPADIYARFVAARLQDEFKQPFVVDDKPGAGSIIGTNVVAQSKPDGYTLLMMSNTHTVNETLMPDKPFQLMRDFVGIAPINASDLMLVVHPSVAARTLPELIAYAKAHPGQLTFASSGIGTPYHMAGELFKHMAGIDIRHIPYKGSSGARTDVIGGQVDMMFDAVTTMAPLAKAGKVRALATSGLERNAITPDVPTLNEAGVPKYEATIWLGLMAPRATPPAIVEALNAAVRRIVARPDVQALWRQQGAVPMSMGVADFDRYLRADIAKWAAIVKLSGAKAH
ncbi:MAG: tripartite tricarboxylate transporter substrate binding protein [Burkholderiales bacterium]|nr:tripartite tricarboxylate transporter substrate binding protein [Burkholderiales bacterium]MDE1926152.1 tripartite tricarboxylate transporter substrate binding protein [Burkholderiales bacterium]MDE2160502.1 tripartite tricarboxylate transporter substrate binding protein [Burkholderiales bacterium]MDE2502924.1 tripartite tricarboxylate transporter substrate binding protein [Burkholderiales bacterium]